MALDGDVGFVSESLRQVLWASGFAGLGISGEECVASKPLSTTIAFGRRSAERDRR
jgi:hypothetical protein